MRKIMKSIRSRIHNYWILIKSLQTALLLVTGLAGYISARQDVMEIAQILAVAGSMFLAISGSTVLNMYYDRDIDSKMPRTCWRPLPTGHVTPREALLLGLLMSVSGIVWAMRLSRLYGAIILAGVIFDVFVYTFWLKRRSAWSIIFGGIAGGMPVMAGRALVLGYVDWIGVLLAAAILFWIPTHILTFNMRYFDDYKQACIPTFPSVYGFQPTHITIAFSSIIAAISMIAAAVGIGVTAGTLRLMGVLSCGLLFLAVTSMLRPSERMNFGLFKYASLYMLGAMLMIAIEIL